MSMRALESRLLELLLNQQFQQLICLLERSLYSSGFLLNRTYASDVIDAKNASEAATCMKLSDGRRVFPIMASIDHMAPAKIPKRIPIAFGLIILGIVNTYSLIYNRIFKFNLNVTINSLWRIF